MIINGIVCLNCGKINPRETTKCECETREYIDQTPSRALLCPTCEASIAKGIPIVCSCILPPAPGIH